MQVGIEFSPARNDSHCKFIDWHKYNSIVGAIDAAAIAHCGGAGTTTAGARAGRVQNEFVKESLATQPQLLQSAEAQHGPIFEILLHQRQVRKALYQPEDCLLRFDTGQMGSQAQMFAAAK